MMDDAIYEQICLCASFSRMISMNERIWANEGNEWHLIQSAIRVVTLLADNAQSIWYRSK